MRWSASLSIPFDRFSVRCNQRIIVINIPLLPVTQQLQ